MKQWQFRLVLFILFTPSCLLQIIQVPTPIPYSGKLVKQVPLTRMSKTLLLINSKAIAYDSQGEQELQNWSAISSLNTGDSSIMRELLNGNLAMICGSVFFTIFNDRGEIIKQYSGKNGDNAFDPYLQCSFTEISLNYFLIAYVGKTTNSYSLELVRYDENTQSFLREMDVTFPKQRLRIACNVFTFAQCFVCIYSKTDNKLHGQLWPYSLISQANSEFKVSDETVIGFYELIVINERKNIVFFGTAASVFAKIFSYENNAFAQGVQTIIAPKDGKAYTFRAVFLAKLNNDMFVASINSYNYAFIQKFYNNLELNGDLMVFFVAPYPALSLLTHSLTILGSGVVSLIITEADSPNNNIKLMLLFPTCKSREDFAGTETVLDLTELGNKSISGQMIQFTKKSPADIPEKVKMPFTPQVIAGVPLSFTKGGVFTYTFVIVEEYTLYYSTRVHSNDCTLKVNVCFKLCDTCYSYGNPTNHQCITCIEGYYLNSQKKTDCIWGCDPDKYYYYHDRENNVDVCLKGKSCSHPDYPTLVTGTNECIQGCSFNFEWDKDERKCKCNSPLVENKITLQCVTYEDFVNDINDRINNKLDDNLLKLYESYPMWNQSNSSFSVYENTPGGRDKVAGDKLASIEYDDCGLALRVFYRIPIEEPLLIAKFDINNGKQLTNQVTYTVYTMQGIKLDTSICSLSVEIITPIIEPDDSYFEQSRDYSSYNIDLFNASDLFFNDICTIDPLSKKDMTLEERRLLFNNGSLLCNNDCMLLNVNLTSNKAVCTCNIKLTNTPIKWHHLTLTNVIPYSNVELSKCFNLVFRLTNLYLNSGCILNMCLFIIELALAIAFVLSQVSPLKIYLSHLHEEAMKYHSELNKNSQPQEIHKLALSERSNLNENNANHLLQSQKRNQLKRKYPDEQISNAPFTEALRKDDRNFYALFCYYFNLFFCLYHTITPNSFTRAKLIQISMLFFCIASDFFFNALLFTDNYISKEDFRMHLPRAIYASLASYCLKMLMQLLSSMPSEVTTITAKVGKPIQILLVSKRILNEYAVKVNLYIMIQFILLCCFWYYSTAFCSVYAHSQVNWVGIALMSFVFNLILSLLSSVIFASLRASSLLLRSSKVYLLTTIVKYVN